MWNLNFHSLCHNLSSIEQKFGNPNFRSNVSLLHIKFGEVLFMRKQDTFFKQIGKSCMAINTFSWDKYTKSESAYDDFVL